LRTPVDDWLERQQALTAVERFSRWHDERPARASMYRDRLPAAPPAPGQQYAFSVDLDVCSGCKACVTACHNLNGLDPEETWRDVGQIVGGTGPAATRQHVTTACHHCADPACLEGCPVNAYEKDPLTGIVSHLDDQCIGCRYCTLKCPYDAPKYNARLGIVRKCDLCAGRLAVHEAPACVQACPNGAIRITVVEQRSIGTARAGEVTLPGAPDPVYTRPATVWKASRPLPPDAVPDDSYRLRPGDAHPPLVAMLVLTQLSVGGFVIGRIVEAWTRGGFAAFSAAHAMTALAFALIALAASTLHLGRPHLAWRAMLGIRHSWLSREIAAFTAFAGLAGLYAGVTALAPEAARSVPGTLLGALVALAGVAGVACSAMLYHDTRRAIWRLRRTGLRFALTALILGTATTLAAGALVAALSASDSLGHVLAWGRPLCLVLVTLVLAKLGAEVLDFRFLGDARHTPGKRLALLLTRDLQQATLARFATGLFGGVLAPLFLYAVARSDSGIDVAIAVVVAFVFTLAGETLERSSFFRASAAPGVAGEPTA
jgi:Fe-S-cluster-containing dehydrogenase component/DMSO reductase anchor subunit